MAFDKNTMFFDTDSAVTETTTSSAMDFHGPDLDEVDYRIVVNGTISGTSPTLTPSLETSDDNSNFSKEVEWPAITGAGDFHHKYRCKKRYRKLKLTAGGTSPSFGHVEAGIDSGSRYDKK